MEIEPYLLLQRYRRDRRSLLEFTISTILPRDDSGGSFDLSTVDLDTVSVDYVIECAQSGRVFDPLEAAKRYYEEWDYPIMTNSSSENSFFLLSKPDWSGSPPRRAAPEIRGPVASNSLYSAEKATHLAGKEIKKSGTETIPRDFSGMSVSNQPFKDANMLTLGLPALSTGLSEDDMRETAYEVLLGSVISSGRSLSGSKVLLSPIEERKKEKKLRFVAGLRSKNDGSSLREQSEDGYSDLLDVLRGQMEISVTMDARIKQSLTHLRSNMTCMQVDVPQIALELLISICRSDFPNQRSYAQWLKRQANILEELLLGSDDFVADERMVLSMLLSQLKNVEARSFLDCLYTWNG